MTKPVSRKLTVVYTMWSRASKRFTAMHGKEMIRFRKMAEVRVFAKEHGYTGIRGMFDFPTSQEN